jgi:hypothetical protein
MPQHYVGLIKEPFLPHGQRAKEEWKKGGGRREGDEHLRTNKYNIGRGRWPKWNWKEGGI